MSRGTRLLDPGNDLEKLGETFAVGLKRLKTFTDPVSPTERIVQGHVCQRVKVSGRGPGGGGDLW